MSRSSQTRKTIVREARTPRPARVASGANVVSALNVSHPESLSDRDLLECVLQVIGNSPRAVQKIVRTVLRASSGIGGLSALVHLWLHRVDDVDGPPLPAAQLRVLAAALELGGRASREPLNGLQITSHRDVQRWARGRLVGLEYEEVWVLALRANQRVCAEWCVARGGVHGCGLLPADVLRPVLRCAASAFILVHNHPSGDPTPSKDDVVMTNALHQACLAVGVTLIDHVIVSRGGSYSLAEACLFAGFARRNAAE
jgi:DNA repair protein RadC